MGEKRENLTINDEKNISMIDSDRSDSSFNHNLSNNKGASSFIGKPPLGGPSAVQRDNSANALRS